LVDNITDELSCLVQFILNGGIPVALHNNDMLDPIGTGSTLAIEATGRAVGIYKLITY